MAADFRCEQCGEMIRADVGPGQAVVCPFCNETVVVPAGLASLPQPNVPPNAERQSAPPPPQEPTEEPPEELPPEEEHHEAVIGVMAAAMPWMISLFLHVALALILLLFVVVVINPALDPSKVTVPDAKLSENPGGNFSTANDSAQSMTNRRRVASRNLSKKETGLVTDAGQTSKAVSLYASGGASGGGAQTLGLAGGAGKPGVGMYGSGGNAHHIVYVIDRSGSMVDSFNLVKRECAKSIGRLSPVQDFHIILFSEGPPLEPNTKRLVNATAENKLAAVEFLKQPLALAKTDPIPALRRAFSVLAQADRRRQGKLMYLLTDGVFPDNDQVLRVIDSLNVKKDVLINTILYGNKPKVAETVMQTIARKNGGIYKFVQEDE